jgi:hypothetical protein
MGRFRTGKSDFRTEGNVMEILVIGLLVIFVPLIMVVIGLKLFNTSAETIAQTRKESKDFKVDQFANKFFKANGINASWESYISAFQNQFGRKPQFIEIKVPLTRGGEINELLEICRAHGIH